MSNIKLTVLLVATAVWNLVSAEFSDCCHSGLKPERIFDGQPIFDGNGNASGNYECCITSTQEGAAWTFNPRGKFSSLFSHFTFYNSYAIILL